MTAYASRDGSDVACCRMNIPLKLSWSFTPWKVQGQTIPPDLLLNHFKRHFVYPGYFIVVKGPYVTNHFFVLLLLSNMIGLKFKHFAHLFVNHFKILCSHGIFSTETHRMSIN